MLKEKIYFIVGIGTDIGKTFLVENLCEKLKDSSAIKPIASGFSDDDKESDSAKILKALRVENSLESINAITPWRFKDAISPHFAAKNASQEIDLLQVKTFCLQKISQAKKDDNFLFIEAAGGVMTPINKHKTFLDLAVELNIPTLLVSANYLGSISHTLCAYNALSSKSVNVEAIIINQDLPALDESAIQNEKMAIEETIQNFSGVTTLSLQEFLKTLD